MQADDQWWRSRLTGYAIRCLRYSTYRCPSCGTWCRSLTQTELGEAIDRSPSWIAKYENYGGLASFSQVQDLSNRLSVPVDTLRRWVAAAQASEAPRETIDRRVAAYVRRSLRFGDTGWASGANRALSK